LRIQPDLRWKLDSALIQATRLQTCPRPATITDALACRSGLDHDNASANSRRGEYHTADRAQQRVCRVGEKVPLPALTSRRSRRRSCRGSKTGQKQGFRARNGYRWMLAKAVPGRHPAVRCAFALWADNVMATARPTSGPKGRCTGISARQASDNAATGLNRWTLGVPCDVFDN
jgi:hypothetical protein